MIVQIFREVLKLDPSSVSRIFPPFLFWMYTSPLLSMVAMSFLLQITHNGLFVEHGQSLVHFIQSHCRFALFKITDKPQSQTRVQRKLLLCETRSASFLFQPLSDRVIVIHILIITYRV